MKKSIGVSASILCADFARLGEEIKKIEEAGADMIHVDVMDGHFVPNITIGPVIVQALRPLTRLPIEAHLMIEHPGVYIDDFIRAGADIISIQAECYGRSVSKDSEGGQYPRAVSSIDTEKAGEDIRRIKKKGKKAFMVVNPGTSLCMMSLLDELDGVLIMSVHPGFAKQKFMAAAIPKIQELRRRYDGPIAVDGGINEVTAPEAVKAGADILVTASYFFGSGKPKDVVRYLKSLKAQTAIEYMLLLGVVVATVLIGLKVYLPQTKQSANLYFNRTAVGILGTPNPCGDGYCCEPFEDISKCQPDCDMVGGDILLCPP